MKHTYTVEGMHCRGCTEKITRALLAVPGVASASVTLDPPLAVVETGEHIPYRILSDAAGRAGGYRLEPRDESTAAHPAESRGRATMASLTPLVVVIFYIVGGVLLRAAISGDSSLMTLMSNFMGGFFIVFSLFKLLDLKGFAAGYATYDVLGRRSHVYALAYPFLELGLGVSYLLGAWPLATNAVTFALMTVGSIGVMEALRARRAIQCACLGTALKLPMTKVTLVEDLAMGLMALVMIFMHLRP